MDVMVVHFLNGISYAMVLFLVASGLSLIRGVMGILNLAHGALYLLGSYVGWTLAMRGVNFWLTGLIAGLIIGVLGLIMQRWFLNRMHGVFRFREQALLTLGITYIIQNVILWIWGPDPVTTMAPSYLTPTIVIGRFTFPIFRFFIMGLGLAIFGALWWFQDKTRAGAIVRAGMDDRDMTTALGLNYGLICTIVFFFGAFVAGAAGFIALPWLASEFRMGWQILVFALVCMVIGGHKKVQGALLGAVAVGLVDSYGKAFLPTFSSFSYFILMIVMLLVRPQGLLGGSRQ